MTHLQPEDPWTRDLASCVDATRVLVFRHLIDDQYVIIHPSGRSPWEIAQRLRETYLKDES